MKIKHNLSKLKFKLLHGLGFVERSQFRKLEKEKDFQLQRYKDEKAKREALQKELDMLKKKIKVPYPKTRDGLRTLSGKRVTLTAVFIQTDNRGTLIRYVNHNKRTLCDHLWLKDVNKTHLQRGDQVQVKGIVQKYASMSYTKALTENHGLFDVSIKKLGD